MSKKLQLGSVFDGFDRGPWHRRVRARLNKTFFALLVSSALLTSAGFFHADIWLWVAYLPLLVALFSARIERRAALVAGHFGVTITIASLGLISLGYAPLFVLGGGLLSLLGLALLMARFGIGIISLLLLLLPWFPGNPLFMAGAAFPSSGLIGLAAFAAIVILIERLQELQWKLLAGILAFATPSLFIWDMQGQAFGRWLGLAPTTEQSIVLDGFEPIQASTYLSNVPLRQIQFALLDAPAGSTLITGENLLKAPSVDTLASLCRIVKVAESRLYVGVEAEDGRAEIWHFTPETCAEPERTYRAVLGIPGLTGPELASPGQALRDTGLSGVAEDGLGFLACFEGFSLHRWAAYALSGQTSVAVVSNDHWTNPLPLHQLRQKVGTTMARLFRLKAAYTNTAGQGPWLIKQGERL